MLTTFGKSLRLLATPRFGVFWFASLLSSIGTWAQQVAEPWLLLTLGASSFVLGLDTFAMSAPVWLLTLAGGALADRGDRRKVIAIFQTAQMLCPAAVVALLLTGRLHVWMVLALSAVIGVTDALSMPSFQSIVPSIVTREQIPSGLALNSTQFNLSRILGPSIAGVLMGSVGVVSCFVVSVASYLPFIGVALWILPHGSRRDARKDHAEPAAPNDGSDGGSLVAQLTELVRQPHLRGALVTVLTTGMLCAPLITFAPVLVKDVFHGSAAHFSTAMASFGAGGLLGAAVLLGVSPSVDRRRLTSAGALASGAMVVLSGLVPWFWALPPILVLAGATMTVSNTSASTLLQALARPAELGRTVSLYMLALRGGISLGALLTGGLVDLVGVQGALLVDGGVALIVHAVVSRIWVRTPLPEPGGVA